jgi:hypothetical protein
MYGLFVFLYLILTRHKFTEWYLRRPSDFPLYAFFIEKNRPQVGTKNEELSSKDNFHGLECSTYLWPETFTTHRTEVFLLFSRGIHALYNTVLS